MYSIITYHGAKNAKDVKTNILKGMMIKMKKAILCIFM